MDHVNSYFVHSVKRRYYKMHLYTDLFGDWMLTKIWGSLDNHQGRILHCRLTNFEEGEKQIESLSKHRIKRGYVKA